MSEFDFDAVYTPSELNREVRLHLEAGFNRVSIEGEISNLARPASGHLYFSLKDDSAQVRCAMFRNAAQKTGIRPDNGMLVLARGRISLYEPRGDYQFIAESLQEAGVGLLQQRFEALKKKLETEGLFDPARKRTLPRFPFRIGVITSPSGAVIRDIMHVLSRRWPAAEVRLYGSPVQGAEAPAALCAALARANRECWAEILIIARGGGSLEDLQAFNDETVARAVATSELPVVSAVGHETDYSICDFVADLRAPTPSAAAELATPDAKALSADLQRTQRQLTARMQFRLQQSAQKLDHQAHRLSQQHPQVRLNQQKKDLHSQQHLLFRALQEVLSRQRKELVALEHRLGLLHPKRQLTSQAQLVKALNKRLVQEFAGRVARERSSLQQRVRTLDAVSPLATLARGYAVLQDEGSGKVISKAGDAEVLQPVFAQLQDGRLHMKVERISPERLLDPQ